MKPASRMRSLKSAAQASRNRAEVAVIPGTGSAGMTTAGSGRVGGKIRGRLCRVPGPKTRIGGCGARPVMFIGPMARTLGHSARWSECMWVNKMPRTFTKAALGPGPPRPAANRAAWLPRPRSTT